MGTVHSVLEGRDVDSASEEWRHECECRWLLANKPTRSAKHLYLYGVDDRVKLMAYDAKGRPVLADDHASRWTAKNPLMKHRGLAGADRILADAKRLYDHDQTK